MVITEMFSKLCTIRGDTSRAFKPLHNSPSNRPELYRHFDFTIILLFGLTELKAQLSWMEQASGYLHWYNLWPMTNDYLGKRDTVRPGSFGLRVRLNIWSWSVQEPSPYHIWWGLDCFFDSKSRSCCGPTPWAAPDRTLTGGFRVTNFNEATLAISWKTRSIFFRNIIGETCYVFSTSVTIELITSEVQFTYGGGKELVRSWLWILSVPSSYTMWARLLQYPP